MTAIPVARGLAIALASLAVLLALPFDAAAQFAFTPPTIEGYAMFGRASFMPAESFETILGKSSGPLLGGGVRIGPGLRGLFFDVGAWRFHADGERVFVFNGEVFPLGIPASVSVMPLEISGGWRFRVRRLPKLVPYVAGGLTSVHYEETSEFATSAENTNEFFNGIHLLGGAQYKIRPWLGVAGEASWSTVGNALGDAGVSKVFNESDLGSTTLRFKITIGR